MPLSCYEIHGISSCLTLPRPWKVTAGAGCLFHLFHQHGRGFVGLLVQCIDLQGKPMEGPGPYMSMVSPKKREVNQANFHFKNDGQLIILSIFLGLLQDDLIWEFKMFR